MGTENGKVSFGFKKMVKKPNEIIKSVKNNSVELIDCLEGKEIKVKDPIIIPEKKPLVIPLKGNASDIVSRIEKESLKNKYIKTEIKSEHEIIPDTRPDSELTIEELAARQLIKEAKDRLEKTTDTTKVFKLEVADEKKPVDGKEPSLADYENIPITDFGLALLRGMGWKEGMCIGKNQNNTLKPYEPDLRPKGLGLGAQKIAPPNNEKLKDKSGKELILKRGAFVKIIAGPHLGLCGEVQGLDEESGRVFVKSNSNGVLLLNEAFVLPISKEDFNLTSRVINNSTYEIYKKIESDRKQHKDSLDEDELKAGKSGIGNVSSEKYEKYSRKISKKKSSRKNYSESSSGSTDRESNKKEKTREKQPSHSRYDSDSSDSENSSDQEHKRSSRKHSKHHSSSQKSSRHSSSHSKKSKKQKHIKNTSKSRSRHKKSSKSRRNYSSESSNSSTDEKYHNQKR